MNEKKDNETILKQFITSLIELIVSIIVGIIFYFPPLSKPDIGIIVWIIGTLLVLNRIVSNYLVQDNFKKTENKIKQISKIIDIEDKIKVEEISKILEIYLKITEPEFTSVKDKYISETINKLNRLNFDKHSEELPTSEYYSWLLPILDKIDKGDSIKAISFMFEPEWDESPVEKKFIKGNLVGAKKGAIVERIFIMKKDFLNHALQNKAVFNHTAEQRKKTKLIGYFVDKEKLAKEEPKLLASVGDGFIIFNDRVALIDRFDIAGNGIRGVVTMNPSEINDMLRSFQLLKQIAEDLSTSLIRYPKTPTDTTNIKQH